MTDSSAIRDLIAGVGVSSLRVWCSLRIAFKHLHTSLHTNSCLLGRLSENTYIRAAKSKLLLGRVAASVKRQLGFTQLPRNHGDARRSPVQFYVTVSCRSAGKGISPSVTANSQGIS